MKQGYIKLYRDLTENWLWEEKPFSKGQAWVDILMMVNHESAKVRLGKELIEVERGSCITSVLKLSDRWGWSRHKVDDFFKLLEKEQMLGTKKDNKKTILTVCNYSLYQGERDAEGQQKDNKRTTKGQQKDTNNNNKNNYINLYNKEPSEDLTEAEIKLIKIRDKIFSGGD